MTAQTKAAIDKWNTTLGSPIFQLLGKIGWGFVLGLVTLVGALAIYAGKSKAHELIASDIAVIEAQVGIKELKTSVEAFHIASQQRDVDLDRKTNELADTNKRVIAHLEESTKERQAILIQLSRLQETVLNNNNNLNDLKQSFHELAARK